MLFEEKSTRLRDGRGVLLRSPMAEDAADMLAFIVQASGETEFLMCYPEEYEDYILERERAWLRSVAESRDGVMIACFVEGKLAGNCQLQLKTTLKERHRARVAIALLREYWGCGIGTLLFQEMIRLAEARGVRQLELDFIEGNERARGLYEKMGFRITGIKQDAVCLKDGRYRNEYIMIKKL